MFSGKTLQLKDNRSKAVNDDRRDRFENNLKC